jgi:hypothetical protein
MRTRALHGSTALDCATGSELLKRYLFLATTGTGAALGAFVTRLYSSPAVSLVGAGSAIAAAGLLVTGPVAVQYRVFADGCEARTSS